MNKKKLFFVIAFLLFLLFYYSSLRDVAPAASIQCPKAKCLPCIIPTAIAGDTYDTSTTSSQLKSTIRVAGVTVGVLHLRGGSASDDLQLTVESVRAAFASTSVPLSVYALHSSGVKLAPLEDVHYAQFPFSTYVGEEIYPSLMRNWLISRCNTEFLLFIVAGHTVQANDIALQLNYLRRGLAHVITAAITPATEREQRGFYVVTEEPLGVYIDDERACSVTQTGTSAMLALSETLYNLPFQSDAVVDNDLSLLYLHYKILNVRVASCTSFTVTARSSGSYTQSSDGVLGRSGVHWRVLQHLPLKSFQLESCDVAQSVVSRHFIPSDYNARSVPHYFADAPARIFVFQTSTYNMAAHILNRFGDEHSAMLDLGCGSGNQLSIVYSSGRPVIAVDLEGPNLSNARLKLESVKKEKNYAQSPSFAVLAADFEREGFPVADMAALPAGSVCVSADVIEHLVDPVSLIHSLRLCMLQYNASAAILSTPDRAHFQSIEHRGPPSNQAHTREHTLAELTQLSFHHGLPVVYSGNAYESNAPSHRNSASVIVASYRRDIEQYFKSDQFSWRKVEEDQVIPQSVIVTKVEVS